MNYADLLVLKKKTLKNILISQYPHLAGSLYKCTKRALVAEIKNRKIFGEESVLA